MKFVLAYYLTIFLVAPKGTTALTFPGGYEVACDGATCYISGTCDTSSLPAGAVTVGADMLVYLSFSGTFTLSPATCVADCVGCSATGGIATAAPTTPAAPGLTDPTSAPTTPAAPAPSSAPTTAAPTGLTDTTSAPTTPAAPAPSSAPTTAALSTTSAPTTAALLTTSAPTTPAAPAPTSAPTTPALPTTSAPSGPPSNCTAPAVYWCESLGTCVIPNVVECPPNGIDWEGQITLTCEGGASCFAKAGSTTCTSQNVAFGDFSKTYNIPEGCTMNCVGCNPARRLRALDS